MTGSVLPAKGRGATLIEILVALIVISVIIAAVGASFHTGLFLLKQAEYKSRAISVATAKMQETLARTYETAYGSAAGDWDFDDPDAAVRYFWNVSITNETLGQIPYRAVRVNCSYTERQFQDPSKAGGNKTVSLSNIIPYPYIHSTYSHKEFGGTSGNVYPDPAPLHNEGSADTYKTILTYNKVASAAPLTFQYETPKDVVVFYYIVSEPADTASLEQQFMPADTIDTRCVFDGVPITNRMVTRAPILTQPFQSNYLTIPNVAAHRTHTVDIQWQRTMVNDPISGYSRKKAPNNVRLREFNIVTIAYENATGTW